MKKQVLFFNGLEGPRALLSAFRRALVCGCLLFAVSGCTPEGITLLSQLEATPLKKAMIDDKIWCKKNVGGYNQIHPSAQRRDLCARFFASLRITSHCLEMRKTEPVEQEYCERFIYRMLIRPTRFFGTDDGQETTLVGENDISISAGDWFNQKIINDFIRSDSETGRGKRAAKSQRGTNPVTNSERDRILKRIAKSGALAQGIRARDQLHNGDEDRGVGMAGSWRGFGSGYYMFRLEKLFDIENRPDDEDKLKLIFSKLNQNLELDVPDAEDDGDRSFIEIALSQDPVNIRAVQWIDDYFFESSLFGNSYKEERKFYLKSWCNLDWGDGDIDEKMLDLHDMDAAWHEENYFFSSLLFTVLTQDRPDPLPASAAWWVPLQGSSETAQEWTAARGKPDQEAEKVKALLNDGDWRPKICHEDLPFKPYP